MHVIHVNPHNVYEIRIFQFPKRKVRPEEVNCFVQDWHSRGEFQTPRTSSDSHGPVATLSWRHLHRTTRSSPAAFTVHHTRTQQQLCLSKNRNHKHFVNEMQVFFFFFNSLSFVYLRKHLLGRTYRDSLPVRPLQG